MKKFLSMAIVATLAFSAVSCSSDDGATDETATTEEAATTDETATDEAATDEAATEEAVVLKDGEYTATQAAPDEKGYTASATVTVTDGAITSVNLDAVDAEGKTKKEASENGEYDMESAGAQAAWHEEIATFEQYIVDNQGVENLTLNEEGKTDAITGVTISLDAYVPLVQEAIAKAK